MTAPALILLDIDGVIIPFDLRDHDHPDVRWRLGLIARLASLLSARIVITSTWRVQSDLPDWLDARGLPKTMLWDPWRTPLAPSTVDPLTGDMIKPVHLTRSQEVTAFLRDHGVSRYFIFDDDDIDPAISAFHLQPSPYQGIGRGHVDVALTLAQCWPRA